MCGICGVVKYDNSAVKKEVLETMISKQRHRGPNDQDIYIDGSVGFGFVRLSILDLTICGRQPMQDSTGRYTIAFNGEIYNYIELRKQLQEKGVKFSTNTDTEVLLQMYIHYKEKCLELLNGMFAFAIRDKEDDSIFAARDRFGVKPFYYHNNPEKQFIFASEIPPILAIYEEKNEANEQQIFDYLLFNRTDHTEDTFFKGVKKLQHGHYIRIERDRTFEIKRWYNAAEHIGNEKADIDKYRQLLIDSVKIRMRSDVPVGICLSGGLDSSVITSIVEKELGNREVHTFSAIFDSGKSTTEQKYIDLYKSRLKNMHYTKPNSTELFNDLHHFVRIHAEPLPTTSPYAQYKVMQLAKDYVTVTLDGQGADEVLGGYHYFFGFYFKDLLKSGRVCKLTKEIISYLKIHKSTMGLKTFAYFLLPNSLKTKSKKNRYIDNNFYERVSKLKNSEIVNSLYSSKSLKEAIINHLEYKLEHLLKWEDRNSMAFSLEGRTPFLDYKLIEYTLSLSSEAIINGGVTKKILRESMKEILPEEIRTRQDKIGFVTPQDEWFRTEEFSKFISGILNSESFKKRKIIEWQTATEQYDKHLSGEINISKDIWKWINLELWYREYIDCEA